MRIETPRGSVVQVKSKKGAVTAKLEWNPDFQDVWEARHNRAQVYLDSEVLRQSAPYTPFQSGMLQKSSILGTVPGQGEVVWLAPYSHYHYYGKVRVGRAPKKLTDRNLQHQGAPLRGPFWVDRMWADRGKKILAGVRRLAGGKAE